MLQEVFVQNLMKCKIYWQRQRWGEILSDWIGYFQFPGLESYFRKLPPVKDPFSASPAIAARTVIFMVVKSNVAVLC